MAQKMLAEILNQSSFSSYILSLAKSDKPGINQQSTTQPVVVAFSAYVLRAGLVFTHLVFTTEYCLYLNRLNKI